MKKEIKNKHKEISPIKCPNCGEEMNLIIEEGGKIGVCENCGYVEPGYGNWVGEIIYLV